MSQLKRVNAFVKEATGKGIYREMIVKSIHCDKHHGRTEILIFDDIFCRANELFNLLAAFEVDLKEVHVDAWENHLRIGLPEGTLAKKGLG